MKEAGEWRALRLRYLNGNRRQKDEILRSLELVYGYHRKSAIRLLRGELNKRLKGTDGRKPGRPGARSRYQDPLFKDALRRLWRELDYMCSKNLKKALPEWLPFFEQAHGGFIPEIRTKLLTVSPSTIDLLLKLHKLQGRGRCGTTPGTLLRSEIPV